jgi:hypothetical protein
MIPHARFRPAWAKGPGKKYHESRGGGLLIEQPLQPLGLGPEHLEGYEVAGIPRQRLPNSADTELDIPRGNDDRAAARLRAASCAVSPIRLGLFNPERDIVILNILKRGA